MGEGFAAGPVPPPSTVKRPFLDPAVDGLPGFAVILTVEADEDDTPAAAAAGELPCGRGAIGRGRICRRRLPVEFVELAVDCGLSFELIERGDGPTTGGDGVLVEMVNSVQRGGGRLLSVMRMGGRGCCTLWLCDEHRGGRSGSAPSSASLLICCC